MYVYQEQKKEVFKEKNQKDFLATRDHVDILLEEAVAFGMLNAVRGITGDSWTLMAYVDRLLELGEIKEVTPDGIAGQSRVFVAGPNNKSW